MQSQDPQSIGDSVPNVRTIVFVDVVEYVRLSDQNEDDAARRLEQVVDRIENDVLVTHGGRFVHGSGDGVMLEFSETCPAVRAAFAIQSLFHSLNEGVPPERLMLARIGVHRGRVIPARRDILGSSPNLAQRLTTIAGPGEIVVSAVVRDQLTDDLDAEIEDLGECFLKHVAQPVRGYRVGPPGPRPIIEPGSASQVQLRPAIAVIPFSGRGIDAEHRVLGEVFADDIISALSRAADLNVISRLSTTAFRDRDAAPHEIGKHLSVTYVLSGTYRVSGRDVVLVAELAEAASGEIVWGDKFTGQVSDILRGEDKLIHDIVARVSAAILNRELERTRLEALPTLQSYTLLMGAITLMHRGSSVDFDRSRQMLEIVAERSRRLATPHAWLAKWHVLRFNRGKSKDRKDEAQRALDCTKRALDAEPTCSLALTIDGFVHTNLLKRLDIAQERYDLALEVNPNDSLAHLLKGTLHAFKGEGPVAVRETEHALKLSPLDPLKYFYESLAATAAHSAGQYDRAIELAQRSLRSNRMHPSTLRALAIAQSQLGRMDDARKTVQELLRLEPNLTVSRYLENNPSGMYETGKVWSEALRRAGLPD
jgi:adenylate cyclase